MKTKLFLYASLVLILASCTGSHGIMKRKYSKGYYLSTSKKVKAPKSLDVQKTSTPELKEAVAKQETQSSPVTVQKQAPETKMQVADRSFNKTNPQEKASTQNKTTDKGLASTAKKEVKEQVKFKPLVLTKKAKNKRSMSSNSADSGAKLIVMIILCLFPLINLIPVYIHDSGVTLNFWVTLILCLTLIGSVIFSLLVVLDVVNLA
jgi:cobalamin biosynthesis Mg chelatase CobN